jgi:hypothetical protein
MKLNKRIAPVAVGAVILVAVGGIGGAQAARLITSEQIKDNTIQARDIDTGAVTSNEVRNGSLLLGDLSETARDALKGQTGAKGDTGATGAKGDAGAKGQDGAPGAKGDKGDDGADGQDGAPGAKGDKGDDGADGQDGTDGLTGAIYRVANYVNGGGGDATVACADDAQESQKYTAISGGVQAGHAQAGYDVPANEFAVTASFPGRMNWETGEPKADRLDGWIVLGNGKYTDNLKVWALCVPNTSILTQVVDLNN